MPNFQIVFLAPRIARNILGFRGKALAVPRAFPRRHQRLFSAGPSLPGTLTRCEGRVVCWKLLLLAEQSL